MDTRSLVEGNLHLHRPVSLQVTSTGISTLVLWLIFSIAGCAQEPVTIAYFYSAVCPSCEESRKLMDLAGSVHSVSTGQRHVTVKTYDLFHDPGTYLDILRKYFDAYQVPSNRQSLPIMFAGEDYYQGSDEIEAAVRTMLREGPPKHGTMLSEDSAATP